MEGRHLQHQTNNSGLPMLRDVDPNQLASHGLEIPPFLFLKYITTNWIRHIYFLTPLDFKIRLLLVLVGNLVLWCHRNIYIILFWCQQLSLKGSSDDPYSLSDLPDPSGHLQHIWNRQLHSGEFPPIPPGLVMLCRRHIISKFLKFTMNVHSILSTNEIWEDRKDVVSWECWHSKFQWGMDPTEHGIEDCIVKSEWSWWTNSAATYVLTIVILHMDHIHMLTATSCYYALCIQYMCAYSYDLI